MRNWLQKTAMKLNNFMMGRNGYDAFAKGMMALALLPVTVNLFVRHWSLSLASLLVLCYAMFRVFSVKIPARRKENEAFLKVIRFLPNRVKLLKNQWRDRKTHTYLSCPGCKAVIRIKKPPKGHTVGIKCPKCGRSFDKKC